MNRSGQWWDVYLSCAIWKTWAWSSFRGWPYIAVLFHCPTRLRWDLLNSLKRSSKYIQPAHHKLNFAHRCLNRKQMNSLAPGKSFICLRKPAEQKTSVPGHDSLKNYSRILLKSIPRLPQYHWCENRLAIDMPAEMLSCTKFSNYKLLLADWQRCWKFLCSEMPIRENWLPRARKHIVDWHLLADLSNRMRQACQ